jgi:hypothetical protein
MILGQMAGVLAGLLRLGGLLCWFLWLLGDYFVVSLKIMKGWNQ